MSKCKSNTLKNRNNKTNKNKLPQCQKINDKKVENIFNINQSLANVPNIQKTL